MLVQHGHFLVGKASSEHISSALLIRFGILVQDRHVESALANTDCEVCGNQWSNHDWVNHLEFESWLENADLEEVDLLSPFDPTSHQSSIKLPSKYTISKLLDRLPIDLPSSFSLGDIHFVTGIGDPAIRIGITDSDGATEAYVLGMWSINVAAELDTAVDLKVPVGLDSRNLVWELRTVSSAIDEGFKRGYDKVVVHSALGMERAPLAVYWYLHRRKKLTRRRAWAAVTSARPVAIDRRSCLYLTGDGSIHT
jgi:hypothetical protein